jgi:lipopolysaccharide cholinephosphotransferase
LFPLTTIQFEGYDFPAPHDSDAYLRKIYGDYMQLPAEREIHAIKVEFLK